MNFKDKKVTVVGLARSGLSAALVLKQAGARVFGTDSGTPDHAVLEHLQHAGVALETGGHTDRALDADVFVLSPGVPLKAPVVQKAQKRGIPILGELELAAMNTQAEIVAVTGSNGKSTTVSLMGEMFRHGPFRSAVGGNIGDALSGKCRGLGQGDVLIAEVSSFQLDTAVRFKPATAVVLNLTPDHLDRYDSPDEYYASKMSIAQNQDGNDLLVLNRDDANIARLRGAVPKAVPVHWFSTRGEVPWGAFVRGRQVVYKNGGTEERVMAVDQIALPGPHNLSNALAAVTAARRHGVAAQAIARVLMQFQGIEHRLEFVIKKRGVRFFNDSKATNTDALSWALQSLQGGIHLIAGGRDKNSDFTALNALVRKHVKAVYALGESAGKIKAAWAGLAPLTECRDMEAAVKAALRNAAEGENVLLSPACASFDMYRNFEERGRHFKRLVEGL
jgi:UDP-N-acetylmuramoylalanine--D-glutamate ligase